MKYTIKWKSNLTSEEGHGESMSKQDAEAWLKKIEKEHPEIQHWIEPWQCSQN